MALNAGLRIGRYWPSLTWNPVTTTPPGFQEAHRAQRHWGATSPLARRARCRGFASSLRDRREIKEALCSLMGSTRRVRTLALRDSLASRYASRPLCSLQRECYWNQFCLLKNKQYKMGSRKIPRVFVIDSAQCKHRMFSATLVHRTVLGPKQSTRPVC